MVGLEVTVGDGVLLGDGVQLGEGILVELGFKLGMTVALESVLEASIITSPLSRLQPLIM
jgi:hypothetical protein